MPYEGREVAGKHKLFNVEHFCKIKPIKKKNDLNSKILTEPFSARVQDRETKQHTVIIFLKETLGVESHCDRGKSSNLGFLVVLS